MRVILASQSKVREQFLRKYIKNLEIVVPRGVEEIKFSGDIRLYVITNAKLKSMSVAKSYPDCLVLGYDTTVWCDGKVYEKPADIEEAKQMLREQRGKIEYICTGMYFIHLTKRINIEDIAVTRVYFKYLSDWDIEQILAEKEILDCGGAYNYKLEGDRYVEIYEGEKDNVVGVPLKKTLKHLRKMGYVE
ncbi:MAG: Maf family protein [Planctomycetota bacterium]